MPNYVNVVKAVKITNDRVKPFVGKKSYLATGDLVGDEIISTKMVTYDLKPSRADLLVTKGDLIVARMKATNKVLFINSESSGFIVSTGFLTLQPKRGFLGPFLYHYFKSDKFQREKDRLCSGATQKAINNGQFKKLQIPQYSINEQGKITKLLNKADSIRKKRQEQIKLIDIYLKSVFLEMFGDPVINDKNIRQEKIGKIGKVITGNTPSRKKKEYYGNYVEWIKSDNINTPEIILTKADEFLSKLGAKVGRIVPKGSVLVTCIAGTPDCIGNCAISDRDVAFNQQINAFIPGKDIKTEFFFAQIFICKRLVQRVSTESMKGLVSKSRFSDIKVLVPSMQQQNQFISIFNSIVNMRKKMRDSLNEMNDFYNALIQINFG